MQNLNNEFQVFPRNARRAQAGVGETHVPDVIPNFRRYLRTTVAKYMVRHRKPPSQSWRTFLKNHAKDLVSADFFIVPTIAFQLLFVFVILDQARRRAIHFAVTANPTAEWTARQLLEAFP